MKFTIITLFPDFFSALGQYSIIGRAIQDGKIEINTINLRDFGLGSYKQVDDKPYGGGAGMLFRVDVVKKAIDHARQNAQKAHTVIALCPRGEKYTQKTAQSLQAYDEIILLCGHYEGFDQRIYDYADQTVSVGDFVLSGGEVAALSVIDSVSRLREGVLGNADSLKEETFVDEIEYPQYTRPEEFEGKKVPEVLLSGDPRKISAWQKEHQG